MCRNALAGCAEKLISGEVASLRLNATYRVQRLLYNLLFAWPIYLKCHYRNVKRLRGGKRFTNLACLSSLVSHSFAFSSSPKPLFSYCIHITRHFLNRILSFSQSIHATYETMTDSCQCGYLVFEPSVYKTSKFTCPIVQLARCPMPT